MRDNLATLVDDFRRLGSATAVVTYKGNRSVTVSYGELAVKAEQFAIELTERKIKQGERVILWGQNSAEWIAVFFGCVLRGALVVPLDASGSVDFAKRVAADTSPRLIVADAALLKAISSEIPQIALDELPAPRANSQSNIEAISLTPDMPLQILFTSGTTSEPKGVVHTHRNVLSSVAPIEKEIEKYRNYIKLVHPLRFLHTLPLSHVFGQFMGLWLPALIGAEVHFESRLQAQRLLEIIHHKRISVLAAVPRVLNILRSHLVLLHPDLQSQLENTKGAAVWLRWWRFRKIHRLLGFKFWAFVCGGASLPPDLEAFWNTLGFVLIQGYGMTETTALITLNHPFKIGKGTIGKPLPGRELRISDEGEVLVRGDMISTATWQQGKLQPTKDAWLSTGDLVKSDDQGQLQFLGRKSQVIVTSSGLNIHPEDIEAALKLHSAIRDSVVVPAPTATGTEAVAVLLVQGNEDDAANAVKSANAMLADYQKIRSWRLWPDLDFPRTSTGKIQRGKVAQWAKSQSLLSSQAETASHHDPLLNVITQITGSTPQKTTDDAHLDEDLRLDSLGRVQLQSELEQHFGIALDDAALTNISTLGELRNHLGLQAPAQGIEPSQQPLEVKPISIAKHIYPSWPWDPIITALRITFIEAIMRPLTSLLASPRIEHEGSLANQQRPLIIIANHVTAYDGALILYALPFHMRSHVAIAMAANLLDDYRHAREQKSRLLNALAPAAYWLITALFNVFPLPRSAGFRESFAHMGKALDRGYNILIFPEGHRSAEGLQSFRSGIGLLVQESNAEVLPVALRGLSEIKQQRSKWFRSGSLTIRVGTPLHFNAAQSPAEITEALEAKLRSMLQ